jgi:asparagine synthetase B (glutamine-hydrolysing)
MPFMDYRLVELMFNLPLEQKVGKGYTKLALRNGVNGLMPRSILERTYKVGVQSPMEYWVKDKIQKQVLEVLGESSFKEFVSEINPFDVKNFELQVKSKSVDRGSMATFFSNYSAFVLAQ